MGSVRGRLDHAGNGVVDRRPAACETQVLVGSSFLRTPEARAGAGSVWSRLSNHVSIELSDTVRIAFLVFGLVWLIVGILSLTNGDTGTGLVQLALGIGWLLVTAFDGAPTATGSS